MAVLVDDLLLLARLDAGRPLDKEQVDITAHRRRRRQRRPRGRPGPHLAAGRAGGVAYVCGDPARLHQVVANLLANARTHTPAGTTVSARVQHVDGEVRRQRRRQRPRHPGSVAAQRLRPLHPRRQLPLARRRQHRPGPEHRAGGRRRPTAAGSTSPASRARRRSRSRCRRPDGCSWCRRAPSGAVVCGRRQPTRSPRRGQERGQRGDVHGRVLRAAELARGVHRQLRRADVDRGRRPARPR